MVCFRLPPRAGPYGGAIGLVVLAALLRLSLGPLWGEDVPALLFYPVVVLSAWYGGLGPGLVTTALSGLAISYYWLRPQYSFAVSDLNDLLGLTIFLAIGLLISILNDRQVRHTTAILATLRKSEQRYRLLFQLNPVAMFQSRRDGHMVDCNDAFVRFLGYASRDDVLARNARDFYMNPQERDELMTRLRPGRVITNQELQWRRSDGTSFSILLSAREDEDGVLDGLVMDIPARRPSRRSG
jgi:PAS domain S-box-containing protein